jgi:hypothetical protein
VLELREFVDETLKELDKRVASDSVEREIVEKELSVEEQDSNFDLLFLTKLKERLVVLFEGLQDEKMVDKEAKLDMTLNFLEYLLTQIEEKLEEKSS